MTLNSVKFLTEVRRYALSRAGIPLVGIRILGIQSFGDQLINISACWVRIINGSKGRLQYIRKEERSIKRGGREKHFRTIRGAETLTS